MALQTYGRHEVGSKYHVEYPVMKHRENSDWAIHHCHARGIRTLDLDILPDEVAVKRSVYAGHVPNEHWPEPLRRDRFKDPEGILHRDDRITGMIPDEWGRLVAHDWIGGRRHTFHIKPIEHRLALCARLDVQALVEPKHSAVFTRPGFWSWFAGVCEDLQVKVAVYSLMHECLQYARHVGIEAWPI